MTELELLISLPNALLLNYVSIKALLIYFLFTIML
jgi:hypothetical protein